MHHQKPVPYEQYIAEAFLPVLHHLLARNAYLPVEQVAEESIATYHTVSVSTIGPEHRYEVTLAGLHPGTETATSIRVRYIPQRFYVEWVRKDNSDLLYHPELDRRQRGASARATATVDSAVTFCLGKVK